MISNPFSRKNNVSEAAEQPLALPLESEPRFTFCASVKPAKVKQWFDDLPITDYQLVATKLYSALPELCRVKLNNTARVEILEHVRPLVLNCVSAITAPLTKKPLALSEKEKKTALVAQALLKHLALAYCRLGVNSLADKKLNAASKASYFQRPLVILSLLLKNNVQLYTPVPNYFWHLTNGVFQLANKQELHNVNVTDAFNSNYAGTCNHSYITILALTVARPLQLRPSEIEQLFSVLSAWAKQLTLAPYTADSNALFAVIGDSDHEPDYLDSFESHQLQASGMVFDFRTLLQQLDKVIKQTGPDKGPVAINLHQHLALNWGTRVRRKNQRIACHTELEICIGISAIHDQLAKGANFDEFVTGSSHKAGFMLSTEWDDKPSPEPPDIPIGSSAQTHRLTAINSGQKGFQLICQDKAPRKLQAGELIGFREPGKRNWQLAVVRWVKRSEKTGIQFGVMMIGRRLEAYGASTETESGHDSDYLRVLLVKEGSEDGKTSLVTPNSVFNERYPVILKKRGESTRVHISKRLSSSASYCQYRYSTTS
ncbi:hypothetical protein [Halioxenophilus aromaticivorans]|uniref:GTPase n=1 Tax=Halioxenophilus aromaticivorans TaxID=1306992 RepID=A0AAV3U2X9_9ALTE